MNKELQVELERIYQTYPKKMGKSLGITRARKWCNTPEKLARLETAIKNYLNYIKTNSTEAQYVKYFSSFMSEWEDWLDPKHGEVSLPGQSIDLSGVFENGDKAKP